MEIEIQGIPQSIRPSYQTRIKSAKSDLQRYKKLSKDAHAQLARSDLLGARAGMGTPTPDEPYGAANGDRTRLLAGTAILEDGSRRLMDSQRIALETEEQGADILRELFGAVIAISLVLAAVFVPVAFFPGTTGALYQQFALTIAFSIVLSTFTALTLTPALSALLLRQGTRPRG